MSYSVSVQCPAKINLFLEVTGKRRDGYHTLATLFAKVNLFDVIDAELHNSGLEVEINDETGQGVTAGPDNLVWKAAKAFRKKFGVRRGIRLRLTKKIPMGAGLGGGSSDAAGTFAAMIRLLKIKQDRSVTATLKKMALELGADVPFFTRPEPLCEGRGIGEKLKAVGIGGTMPWIVLVFPNKFVSTGPVFSRLSLPSKSSVLTSLSHHVKLKKKLEKGRPISEWEGFLFNRLEEAVLDLHPEVRQAKNILTRLKLRGVLMSGSGASVFGFASSREEGEAVMERLKGYPWKMYLTCCLG